MDVLELTIGPVDLATGEVRGQASHLSPMERRLLAYLAAHPGRLIEPDELLREVWGYAESVRSRTVRTTMGRLRRKVEVDPSTPDHLLTEYGAGYRFAPLGSAPPPADAGPNDVPVPVVALEPRVETEAIQAARDRGARLVTLVGPAGIGKTSLLQSVGRSLAAPGGVTWVDLSGIEEAEQLPLLVARALGLRPRPSDDPSQLVGEQLAGRGTSELLLDDVDAVVDAAAAQVSTWLARAEGLRITVACREPLRVAGEARVRLRPLPADAAERVLRRRLEDRGDAEPEPSAVARLVQALDGVPLALELAAAAASFDGVEAVADDIEARLLQLRTDRRDAPERHHSLDAALSTSVARLEPVERSALSQLALFLGPVVPDDAAQVVALDRWEAQVDRAARRLADASLLQTGGGRWRLLAATRAYAWTHLPPSTEAVERFVAWSLSKVAELRATGEPARLRPQRLHLEVARSLTSDLTVRCELDGAVAYDDDRLGAYDAAKDRVDRALDLAPADARDLRAWLGTLRVNLAFATGGFRDPATEVLARRAAEDAEAAGDDRVAVVALRQLGHLWRNVDPPRAIEALTRAVALAERTGAPSFVALPNGELAKLHASMGPLDAAREAMLRAHELFEQVGHESRAGAEVWLALLEMRRGDLGSAEAWLARTNDLPNENIQIRGSIRTAWGRLHHAAGRHAEAVPALEEALSIANEVGNAGIASVVGSRLALALADQGRLDAAWTVTEGLELDHDEVADAVAALLSLLRGQPSGLPRIRAIRDGAWAPGSVEARAIVAELCALATSHAAPDEAASAWDLACAWAGPEGDRMAEGRASLGRAIVTGGDVPRVPPVPELRALWALAYGRDPAPTDVERFLRVRILMGSRA